MAALKFGHLVLEKTQAEVYSFYIDMRTNRRGMKSSTSGCLKRACISSGAGGRVTDAARKPGEEASSSSRSKTPFG
jgi:NADH:ubiquinone oxidoreductase subunit E